MRSTPTLVEIYNIQGITLFSMCPLLLNDLIIKKFVSMKMKTKKLFLVVLLNFEKEKEWKVSCLKLTVLSIKNSPKLLQPGYIGSVQTNVFFRHLRSNAADVLHFKRPHLKLPWFLYSHSLYSVYSYSCRVPEYKCQSINWTLNIQFLLWCPFKVRPMLPFKIFELLNFFSQN